MNKHIGMVILAAAVVAALLLNTVTYKVDETRDIVVIRTFGNITDVKNPRDNPGDAGLHFKWPWPAQSATVYDSRLHLLEYATQQIPTSDQQNVLVTLYCTWRIGDAATFNKSVGTVVAAEARLRDRLGHHDTELSNHPMSDFVSTGQSNISQIEQNIQTAMQEEARRDYGIEVTGVGLKLFGLTETVSAAVIDAQKAEREQEATKFKNSGAAEATAIRERARAAADIITAFANRKAEEIRGEGYAAVAQSYQQFNQDEELSMFLRWLESMRKGLPHSVIILDSKQFPGVKFFKEGPSTAGLAVPGIEPAASVKTNQASGK